MFTFEECNVTVTRKPFVKFTEITDDTQIIDALLSICTQCDTDMYVLQFYAYGQNYYHSGEGVYRVYELSVSPIGNMTEYINAPDFDVISLYRVNQVPAVMPLMLSYIEAAGVSVTFNRVGDIS